MPRLGHSNGRQVLPHRVVPSGPLLCPLDPPLPSCRGTYLRRHAADGWHVVASLQKVGSVAFQLELTQPVINGLSILWCVGIGVTLMERNLLRRGQGQSPAICPSLP